MVDKSKAEETVVCTPTTYPLNLQILDEHLTVRNDPHMEKLKIGLKCH
jgi:hypothetical protein